jgi:hypothetical protein
MGTTTPVPRSRWTITQASDAVTFHWTSGRSRTEACDLPRVWDGRGLAVPAADLPGFAEALQEVLKLPMVPRARAGSHDRETGDSFAWSRVHHDPEDDFLYITGPCGPRSSTPGYRPTATFAIALPQVPGLRLRIAAYLREQVREEWRAGVQWRRSMLSRWCPRAATTSGTRCAARR